MPKKIHDTPMLDELENGPWPSFISGFKRLRDEHPDERINETVGSLLGSARTLLRNPQGLLERRDCFRIWLWWRYHPAFLRSRRRFP